MMSILTRSDTSTALSPDAIRNILARHERAQLDHYGAHMDVFSEQLLYRPESGQLAGTSGQPEAQPVMHRLLGISTHHRVTPEELAEVRVDRDGTVIQPDHLRRPDPVDPPDVIVEPEPALRPPTTIGEVVAGIVYSRHWERVPQEIREPHKGRASRFQMPPETLLYGIDGRFLGSAAALDGAEHAHRCIRLRTDQMPSAAQIAAVVVDERGTVGDIQ